MINIFAVILSFLIFFSCDSMAVNLCDEQHLQSRSKDAMELFKHKISKRFWANILHVSAPDQGAGFIGSDGETFLAVGLTLFGLINYSSWAILIAILGSGKMTGT